MATVTTSKTAAQKARHESNRERICAALGWTLEQHGWFQYKRGISYIREYLHNDAFMVDQLIRSRAFWAWWVNHWNLRDEHHFSAAYRTGKSPEKLRTHYSFLHSITYLNVHPSKAVLEDSYCKMIGELNKTHNA